MNLIEQANFRYNGVNLYLEITEDEALYDCLYHILPRLNEELELFLTSDISDLMTEEDPVQVTQVEVDNQSNLLEIGFTIEDRNSTRLNFSHVAISYAFFCL